MNKLSLEQKSAIVKSAFEAGILEFVSETHTYSRVIYIAMKHSVQCKYIERYIVISNPSIESKCFPPKLQDEKEITDSVINAGFQLLEKHLPQLIADLNGERTAVQTRLDMLNQKIKSFDSVLSSMSSAPSEQS